MIQLHTKFQYILVSSEPASLIYTKKQCIAKCHRNFYLNTQIYIEMHDISSAKCKSVVNAFGPWTCVKQNVPRNNWDFLQ